MSDKMNALIVILDEDTRLEGIQPTIDAIKQLRGVIDVQTNVSDITQTIAVSRAKQELSEKLWKALE